MRKRKSFMGKVAVAILMIDGYSGKRSQVAKVSNNRKKSWGKGNHLHRIHNHITLGILIVDAHLVLFPFFINKGS